MNIVDWFDIHNLDHLKAYKHLQKEGMWPKGFIPENVEFPNNWHILLMSKFTDAYLNVAFSLRKMADEYMVKND